MDCFMSMQKPELLLYSPYESNFLYHCLYNMLQIVDGQLPLVFSFLISIAAFLRLS